MKFNLVKPSFQFENERKYSIIIAPAAPANNNQNDTVTLKVPVFEEGPPEMLLHWRKQFQKLCELKQLNAQARFTNVALLLAGEAEEHWQDCRQTHQANLNATDARFNATMAAFMTRYFTADAAEDLREFLLTVKKPSSMAYQDFVRRVKELNRYLPLLPPPHNVPLQEADLFTCLKKSVPAWYKTFVSSNQRRQITTVQGLTDYYVDLEENELNERKRINNKPPNKSKSPNMSNDSMRTQNHSNYCHVHKTSNHSWQDCRLNPRSPNFDPNQRPPRDSLGSSTPGSRKDSVTRPTERSTSNGNGDAFRRQTRSQAQTRPGNQGYQTRSRSNRDTLHVHEDASQASDPEGTEDEEEISQSSEVEAEEDELYSVQEVPQFLDDPPATSDYLQGSSPEIRLLVTTKQHGRDHALSLRALLDTGATRSVIRKHVLPSDTAIVPDPSGVRTFRTQTGTFSTKETGSLTATFPDLLPGRQFPLTFCIDPSTKHDKVQRQYDVIIGQDMLRKMGLKFDFSASPPFISIDDHSLPMVTRKGSNINTMVSTKSVLHQAEEDFDRKLKILPADYHRADLRSVVPPHLPPTQQNTLHSVLQDYADLFAGKLGCLPGKPIDFHLKPGTTPYHGRAFPVPKVHYQLLRDEVDRLCELQVLRKCNDSPWAAPSFAVPKKNGQIRFVSDFRQLNKCLIRHPFPLPSIPELLRSLEGFSFCTSLDLNMGYWTIRLSPEAQRLCTTVLPWGKYSYLRLPMGVSASPDIYQERMSALFHDQPNVLVYLDDILLLTAGSFQDHMQLLKTVLDTLRRSNLQVHADKSSFCALEADYLGFVLTRDGIKPQPKKVQAILNIAPPTTVKQVRSFAGMVNHYKPMIPRRSHLMAPIIELTKKKHKFIWTEECQKSFDQIKAQLARQISLIYPDYSRPFHIYTDASKLQLGAIVTQDKKPIAFYSRKLTGPQTRYTVTELELLSIVETLKEFRTILLGHHINVYTDHKNLTFDNFSTDRVRRWRLIVEEYGPRLVYIKGIRNQVADTLSRLPVLPASTEPTDAVEQLFVATEVFPLAFDVIALAQQEDLELQALLNNDPAYEQRVIRRHALIYHRDKIVVPLALQGELLQWYHSFLLHPGSTRMYETIRQHFYWPAIYRDIDQLVRNCPSCQRYKRQRKHYGNLPDKTHQPHPWNTVAVDLIGPWTVPQPASSSSMSPLQLLVLTIIDPDTYWTELVVLPNKLSLTIATAFDHEWLCRYPRPAECIHDNGTEFMGQEFQELLLSYGIRSKPTTVRNPQANAILERAHQTIGNMLRTNNLMSLPLSRPSALANLLRTVQWALNATFHTTLQATPAQLVFHRDLILPTTYLANWAAIHHRRQQQSLHDSARENTKRIPHEYRVNDKVLLRRDLSVLGKLARHTEGPFKLIDISQLNINGTVLIDRGNSTERINIRRVLPYFEPHN
jgi:RNase H-like domain found in reverse transcriptase/Integrase zinc binding domain/Reverse transcriptase (RNA-dependent DNA polymerase)